VNAAAPEARMQVARRRLRWRWEWAAVAVVLAGAAALRLIGLGAVRLDPFYDAAVRSMGMSPKNFYFGAWEPGGSASIDKPPVDLWLQVASVKLLGFGSTSLKLPEALGGIAAVGLLYAAVKRVWGFAAGIGAALALAVMPVEVITARSDTMDAVMMALLVGALLLLIKACESGRTGWLLAAAAVLGVAFNVKLLETVVALPGLAVIALLGFQRKAPERKRGSAEELPADAEPHPAEPPARTAPARGGWLRDRALPLAAAVVVYVVVALSWLGGTLLFPAHERPYAIGSSNGSAWNAAFVFNGTERLNGKSLEAPVAGLQIANNPPQKTLSEREAILITPPSPTRLLDRVGPLSGERLGIEALIALLLGIPAIAWGWRGPPLRRAVGVGLVVWFLTGLVLFSEMQRLHPRYTEGFTPAVAALVGIGVAWGAKARARTRLVFLVVALAALVIYSAHLLYGMPAVWWVVLASALGAVTLVVFDRVDTWVAAVALTLVAVLAIPTVASVRAVRLHLSDAGIVGSMPAGEVQALSSYLRANSGGTRYEVAIDSATRGSALIVKDGRPVVILTTYQGRTLTTVAQLKRLIARGEVRYALLNSLCGKSTPRTDAACSEPALWVRAHGRDVSRRAGLARPGVLWRLPETVG
jgi:4-amino-4-deoxy-L-arabinose transferase-like glycosyltransferase